MHTNPFHTIFILGGSLTGLAVIRNAYALKLHPILVCTPGEIASSTRLASVVPVEQMDKSALQKIIGQSSSTERPALIATSDEWIQFIMHYRNELEQANIQILQSENHALNICLDKSSFNKWAMGKKLPVPPFFSIPHHEADEYQAALNKLPYPVMLRPATSQHSNNSADLPKARAIANASDLDEALQLFQRAGVAPLVTQSLLPYPLLQHSVGIVRAGDKTRSFVAQKIRPPADYAAVGTYMSLSPNKAVEELAQLTIKKLDYFGIAEVEILERSDTGELFLIEINARPWLQYTLALKSGHDFLLFLLNSADYQPDQEKKIGYNWIDFNSDFYLAFSNHIGLIRKRRLGLAKYIGSLIKVNAYARLALNDMTPFKKSIHELYQLLTKRKG